MKVSVLRYAAIGMASLSLAGFAAASTVSIGTTGADSSQVVKLHNNHSVDVSNLNLVGANNFNAQSADSGDVSAYKNTTVGAGLVGAGVGAASGDASNSNTTGTGVTV